VDYEYFHAPPKRYDGPTTLMQFEDPDRHPAHSARHIVEDKKQLVLIYEVPGHGALVMRAEVDPADPLGKLKFVGVSEFTNAEIQRGEL
jgi:hypothetical protein